MILVGVLRFYVNLLFFFTICEVRLVNFVSFFYYHIRWSASLFSIFCLVGFCECTNIIKGSWMQILVRGITSRFSDFLFYFVHNVDVPERTMFKSQVNLFVIHHYWRLL